MSVSTGPFRRSDRLLVSRDFRRVSRHGRRSSGEAFVLLHAQPGPGADEGACRIGISASRKVGNAVVRNRIKRRVREWFRHNRATLPDDSDWVVIARRKAADLDAAAIGAALDRLVVKALRPRPGSRA